MEVSFKKYILQNFEDKIYDDFQAYFNGTDIENLNLNLSEIEDISDHELSDLDINDIFAFDNGENCVRLYIALTAYILVKDADFYHNDEYEEPEKRFTACYDFNLNDPNAIELVSINEDGFTFPKKYGLSDALVPYISKDELDNVAEELIVKYYSNGAIPSVVDPYEFASKIGLNIVETILPQNTMGKIYFFGEKAGTAYIQPNIPIFTGINLSVNNTIIHECVHWLLHKKAFMLAKICGNDLDFECKDDGGVSGEAVSWMEYQANMLAPRILMPKSSIVKKAKSLISFYEKNDAFQGFIDYGQEFVDIICRTFGVSKTSAKIRLNELGFSSVKGVYNYVDNKYVGTYNVKKSTLPDNQTYDIPFVDAVIQQITNLQLNNYLYVDSHFVINSPKYVQLNDYGQVELTRYARANIEECCVPFIITAKGIKKEYNSQFVLNRDKGCWDQFSFLATGKNPADEITDEDVRKGFSRYKKQIENLHGSLKEQFLYLRKLAGFSSWDDVANLIECRPGTIRDFVNGVSGCRKDTFAKLCLALHTPYVVTEKLMSTCGISFALNNELELGYRFLLQRCYEDSIYVNLERIERLQNLYKKS